MTRWALQQLHWFDLAQQTELPLRALDALAHRLIDAAIEELAEDLHAGRERMFVECLKMLLGSAWLQSFDRRTLFRQRLAGLLLAVPYWSDALFGAVCDLCGWDETSFDEPWQWHELVRRAEEVVFERHLRELSDHAHPDSAERKAAWLLLKAMPPAERERLKRGMTEEDWAAYQALYDKLRYRYPRLWENAGGGEPEEPEDPAPGIEGWRYGKVALYLLLLGTLLLGGFTGGLFDGSSEQIAKAIPVAIVAVAVCWLLSWLAGRWVAFCDTFIEFDVWLSQLLLLDDWVDGRRGLLVISHLLPCVVLAVLVAVCSGLVGDKLYGLGLLTFVACAFYSLLATRGISLMDLALIGMIRAVYSKLGRALLIGLLLLCLAALLLSQAAESGSASPAVPATCEDESCLRWGEARQALLELARAKRAAEEARTAESSSP